MRLFPSKTLCWICILLCLAMLSACAVGISPDQKKQAIAARNLGEAYIGDGNYTAALAELLKAKALLPNDPIVHNDLGLAYLGKEKIEFAIFHLKKAVQLSPDYAIAKNNLGGAYLVQKDWDAAISVLLDVTDDVLYLTPHFSLTNLGIAYYEKGDYAQAEHYLRKALSLEPDFLVAQYNLGRACMAAGKLDEARMIFEEMTEKDPKNPAFLLEIGRVYRRLGDTQNAVLALRGAIERVRTARHLTPDIATEIADAAVAELDQTYP